MTRSDGEALNAEEHLKAVIRHLRAQYLPSPNGWGTRHLFEMVMEYSGCGSTSAAELCRLAGLDPDERITRTRRRV